MKFSIGHKPELEIVNKFFLFPRILRHWPEDGPSFWATLGVGPETTSDLDVVNVPLPGGPTSWVWLERAWVVRWRLGAGFRALYLANQNQVAAQAAKSDEGGRE